MHERWGGETIFVLHFISCINVVVGSVVLYSVKQDGYVIRKCRYVMIWNQFCLCMCRHVCVCLEGYYTNVYQRDLGRPHKVSF